MSLQKIITAYFSDGKCDSCLGVSRHVTALGHDARCTSGTLYRLVKFGVLSREGKPGNYRYQIAPVQPKGEPVQVAVVISSPKDPEAFAIELLHKVNRMLESTRRRASV